MTETIWHSLYGCLEGNDLLDRPLRPERESEKKFVESLKIKGFTCLDVGFNYGWWTWLLLKNIGREGKVYAWEPNKFLYENYLEKWPFKNLTGYNYALSDKTGEQDYYIYGEEGDESGINSLEREDLWKELPVEIKKVKTETLDDWWNEHGKPKINFIKIDCEGHDYKILQGGKRLIDTARPEYIVIEQKSEDVANFLRNFNYTKQNEHGNIKPTNNVIWKQGIQSTKEAIE